MKRNYRIDGLDCAHCAAKMEKNVSKVKGVKEVSINFLTTKMMLDLEDENLDEIIAGIEAAVKDVEKQFRKFAREQKLKLSQTQFEALLDATHPKLIKLYWPAAAAARILREQGICGMTKKLMERTGKGMQK